MDKRASTGLTALLLLGAAALLLAGGSALAQDGQDPTGLGQPARSAAGYDLSWWTADGGGQTFSTGSGYSLGGTIGQPDAGLLSGSGYTLAGGFWFGGSGGADLYHVYLPVVVRSH